MQPLANAKDLLNVKNLNKSISSAFPFKSNYIKINGANMHYIDEGEGKLILFIHGMPSSSYVWRNIIPQLSSLGRCIAVDLIGHGRSDSPDIEFSVKDHLDYLTQFIQKLDLKELTIVGHSWGATLGFVYARQHESNVVALCYLEPMLGAWKKWENFNPYNPQAQEVFKQFRSPEGWDFIVNQNIFLEQIFVNASIRTLAPEEKEAYIAPFRDIKRRRAAWKAPQELPIEGSPAEVTALVEANFKWLNETTIPQLFFYTDPAAFFTKENVKSFAKQAVNISLHYLGPGIYNHAEDYPNEIANTLRAWIQNDYVLDKAIPQFSLYTNIHKAIRKEIFETCILAGNTDLSETKPLQSFLDKFNNLLSLLRKHSFHEDTFIHPLLEHKKLPEFALLEAEHSELEMQSQHLEQMLSQALTSENKTSFLFQGNQFYLALNQFASDYLKHLFLEETKIMAVLHENYAMPALTEVIEQFKKAQPLEEAMQSLRMMFTAIHPAETLVILSSIQKGAPYELFQKICHTAQEVIPKDTWEKIDSELCSVAEIQSQNLLEP